MSLYRCSGCGCVENTAVSNYVQRVMLKKLPPLCSECDPEIKKWHGRWEKFKPEDQNLVEGPNGYLYDKDDEYLKRLRQSKEKRL